MLQLPDRPPHHGSRRIWPNDQVVGDPALVKSLLCEALSGLHLQDRSQMSHRAILALMRAGRSPYRQSLQSRDEQHRRQQELNPAPGNM